jgi:hypothetical protein
MPLGHKRRGEAAAGIMPIGGKAAGGRLVIGTERERVAHRRIAGARAGQQAALGHRIHDARKEATVLPTFNGRKAFPVGLGGFAVQKNPDNSQRSGWASWNPGGR